MEKEKLLALIKAQNETIAVLTTELGKVDSEVILLAEKLKSAQRAYRESFYEAFKKFVAEEITEQFLRDFWETFRMGYAEPALQQPEFAWASLWEFQREAFRKLAQRIHPLCITKEEEQNGKSTET